MSNLLLKISIYLNFLPITNNLPANYNIEEYFLNEKAIETEQVDGAFNQFKFILT